MDDKRFSPRVCDAQTLTRMATDRMPAVEDGLNNMEWDIRNLSDHKPVSAEIPVKGTRDSIKIVWWNVLNTKWVEYHHAEAHGG